jgi:hypothetical protein
MATSATKAMYRIKKSSPTPNEAPLPKVLRVRNASTRGKKLLLPAGVY